MTQPAVERAHIDRFRALLCQHYGLGFDDGKVAFLREVLLRRTADTHSDVADYLHRLVAPDSRELRALAREVTVGETYFFRNYNHFRALVANVLPARLAARASSRTLELLSAGCASGEEAYSLAMVVRDLELDARWRVNVLAVDVNPLAISKAKRAVYSPWSLREVPDHLRRRWFVSERGEVAIDPAVRAAVRFDERNLTHDDDELWAPGRWDVVFCRNALMYFEPSAARAVIARIARSLAPNGYLFLGHAESLRDLSEDFRLVNTHDTFYYQRLATPGARAAEPRYPALASSPTEAPADGDSWIETIRLTAERIRRLSEQAPPSDARAPLDTSTALALLAEERYLEALAIFEGVDDAELEPMSALLLAVLQLQAGLVSAAERVARRLIARGARVADAEHVLSLCYEKVGARGDAVTHDRRAAELDASFAMPRLHLGLMAYLDGERATVEDELGRAAELLEHEDATRLALFGGGFGRAALMGMCRTTMQRAGSRP